MLLPYSHLSNVWDIWLFIFEEPIKTLSIFNYSKAKSDGHCKKEMPIMSCSNNARHTTTPGTRLLVYLEWVSFVTPSTSQMLQYMFVWLLFHQAKMGCKMTCGIFIIEIPAWPRKAPQQWVFITSITFKILHFQFFFICLLC